MKKSCVSVLLLLLTWFAAVPLLQPSDSVQTPAPGEFPAQLLQGSENFNLAIDSSGDSRGNFGPCG
jgi:hypothetical protein